MMKDETLVVLYEDNHILAIEKPPGLLSQKDYTQDLDVTELAKRYLKEKYNKPGDVYLGLVHRLDRPVGGVMILAKTSKAASRLSHDIRNRDFHKTYLALVEGEVKEEGTIELMLKKDEETRTMHVDEDGKNSLLTYRPIDFLDHKTLLEIDLLTGRFHQIRISLSSMGHPIVNDEKYHAKKTRKNDPLYLWCSHIAFRHPVSKEWVDVVSNPHHWPILIKKAL
ncbi:MAG: RluA family pseudouridine synthase [Bacilli bacterium]|nr:RluA family pseudouridine synthase [Bacilli bacterium]